MSPNPKFIASASDEFGFIDNVYLYSQDIFKFPCSSYYWQYKDVVRNGQTIPNAIEFQYDSPGKGILFPSSRTISYKVGNTTQLVNRLEIDRNNNIATGDIPNSSWTFQNGKICLTNSPNRCLYVDNGDLRSNIVSGSPSTYANLVLADSTNNDDPGFKWATSIATPADGCLAST